MLQIAKRSLVVVLTAATAASSPAYASIYRQPSSGQQFGSSETGARVQQAAGLQTSANGFDWADAGVGAAASALVIGAGGVIGRRRHTRRVVAS